LAEKHFRELRAENKPIQRCIEEASQYAELCPLELSDERRRLLVEPSGFAEATKEQVYCFTAHYQFSGDEQLWHMNPGVLGDLPDGETFRNDLILAILARTASEAEGRLNSEIGRIQEIIACQTQCIRAFHDNLPEYLQALPGATLH
jgi:hypothetical protein